MNCQTGLEKHIKFQENMLKVATTVLSLQIQASTFYLESLMTEIPIEFSQLKLIIISYCKTVISLNISSFTLLNVELEKVKLVLGIN